MCPTSSVAAGHHRSVVGLSKIAGSMEDQSERADEQARVVFVLRTHDAGFGGFGYGNQHEDVRHPDLLVASI
jgi:hypothetical protein